ncbi:rhamnulokinase [Prevotella sp. CAG:255]|nr:rhamnulokinase [Prevotella sp. CAG:255]
MLQAKAAGAVADIFDMRRIIADSVSMKRFEPKDKAEWDAAYEKYLKVVESKENK